MRFHLAAPSPLRSRVLARESILVLHAMGETRGTVADAEGKPRKIVDVVCQSDDGIVVRKTRTDGRGRFRVRHLYAGPYRITAQTKSKKASV